MSAQQQHDAIEPVGFKPSGEQTSSRRLSPWQLALGVLTVLAAVIFWFLFTSKSVQLKFSQPADAVQIEGGFSFELGGVWLLRKGTYQISATTPLHHPIKQEIEVTAARNQVHTLTFEPLPGTLHVTLQPDDARLDINPAASEPDAQQSSNPDAAGVRSIELPAGSHTLVVSHPRYQTETVSVDIRGRLEEQSLSIALTPNWSEVQVTSTPPGASVSIDGEVWPQLTPTTVEALAGEREIAVRLPGFRTARQSIFAQATEPQVLPNFVLVQADATVNVTSAPSGAGVLVNGRFVGRTPLELDLNSAAAQTVKVVNNGYHDFSRTLRLTRGEQTDLHATLRRQVGKVRITVEPQSAEVRVNGKLLGTGNQEVSLPIQPAEVNLTLSGYAGYSKAITPKVGLVQELKVKLLTLEEARLAALKPSITAPDGNNLLLLSPEDFTMGASRREPGRRANETLRDVQMSRLFYLATHEVTNAQFRKFASGHDSGSYVETTLNEDDQPVVNLGWHDAAAYCNWLSEQAGLPPYYEIEFGKVKAVNWGATGYRLPTEAEWSWAARTLPDGEISRFPWGDNLPPPDRHGNYADRAASTLVGRIIFGYNDNYAAAAPVGTFKANHRGIFDLGGNVAEWMNDFYEIPTKDAVADPMGPRGGDYHVIKGSSWMHGSITELRWTFRDYGIDGRQDIGFRLARYAE